MQWTAIVDRLEEDFAVLECVLPGGDKGEEYLVITIPRKLLPEKIKEGDFLTAVWEIDHEKTNSAREEIASILERLANRSRDR
ncbi:MAG TPA: DUF3006 domain-containing protein [Firmicutes bacterium]|nr:DUF3006 domain-containing protein [Bacillota bacterium]